MNTKNLKSYAPKARKQFIEAVKKRAAHFGIYEDRIAEVRIEGGAAIIEGRAFTRKEGEQRKRLEGKLAERGYDMFTREIAYTWFNRLAALRYMEIHDYLDHGFRVLSPAKSHLSNADSLPEILNHASDVAESLNLDKDLYEAKVFSYTKKKEYVVRVGKRFLNKGEKVLIIDDFLAMGCAAKGLLELVKQSEAELVGVGIVIEKGFQEGRKVLEDKGVRVESLAILDNFEDGKIKFK